MTSLRSIIIGWQNWRSRRALERAIPELRKIRIKERELHKKHKKGAKAIQKQRSAMLHNAMRGG